MGGQGVDGQHKPGTRGCLRAKRVVSPCKRVKKKIRAEETGVWAEERAGSTGKQLSENDAEKKAHASPGKRGGGLGRERQGDWYAGQPEKEKKAAEGDGCRNVLKKPLAYRPCMANLGPHIRIGRNKKEE